MTEGIYLRIGSGFLCAKVIGREAEDDEFAYAILFIELFEVFVLRSVATFGSGVYYHYFFSF